MLYLFSEAYNEFSKLVQLVLGPFSKEAEKNASAARQIVDINMKLDGLTLLHLAALREEVNWIKWLIKNGADRDITDKDGKKPLHMTSNNDVITALQNQRVSFNNVIVWEINMKTFAETKHLATWNVSHQYRIVKLVKVRSLNDVIRLFQSEVFQKCFKKSPLIFHIDIIAISSIKIEKKNLKNIVFYKPLTIFLHTDNKVLIYFKDVNENFQLLPNKQTQILSKDSKFDQVLNFILFCYELSASPPFNPTYNHNINYENISTITFSVNFLIEKNFVACAKTSVLSLRFLRLKCQNISSTYHIFEEIAKNGNFQAFAAFLDFPLSMSKDSITLSEEQKNLLRLTNPGGLSLLMISIQADNKDTFQFLLDCGVDMNYKNKDNTAADLAFTTKNYFFLGKLLLAGSNFSQNVHDIPKRGELAKYLKEINQFHNHIEKGDLEECKKFLKNHPAIKCGHNLKDSSALLFALEKNQYGIFAFLKEAGFVSGISENIDRKISQLSDGCKSKICSSYYFFRKRHEKCYLDNLNLNSTDIYSNDVLNESDKEKYKIHRENAFKKLDEIPECQLSMKVVAELKSFKITFDFSEDSVHLIDPSKGADTKGVTCCKEGEVGICIGAKKLLESTTFYDGLGVLAHEISHLKYQVLYENGTKPYFLHENDEKKEFDKTVELYENEKVNEAIKNVYDQTNYPISERPEELIVCVEENLALNSVTKSKLKSTREHLKLNFGDLYTFYEKVQKFTQLHIPSISIKHEAKLLNRKFKLLLGLYDPERILKVLKVSKEIKRNMDGKNKLSVYFSNCPEMTLSEVYENVLGQYKNQDCINSNCIFLGNFSDLISNEYKEYKNLVKRTETFYPLPILVIYCPNYNRNDHSPHKILDLIKTTSKTIIITKKENSNIDDDFQKIFLSSIKVHTSFDYCVVLIEHLWANIKKESQKILLKRKIKFQDNELSYNEFMTADATIAKYIPLNNIIEDIPIEIGSMNIEIFEHEDYIDRTFDCISCNEKDINAEKLIGVSQLYTSMIIQGVPGIGKKRTIIEIAKLMNKSHWLIYIELTKFVCLPEFTSEKNKCCLEFLCHKVLKLKDTFEIELFKDRYSKKKVVLFLDEFDELYSQNKTFVIEIIKSLFESENKYWVITKHTEFFDGFKPLIIKPRNFTFTNKVDFFKRLFGVEEIDIEVLRNNLSKILPPSLEYLLCYPLYLKMLKEIYDRKLIESTIADAELLNIYMLYKKFNERLVFRWFNERESIQAFWELYQLNMTIKDIYHNTAIQNVLGDQFIDQHKKLALNSVGQLTLPHLFKTDSNQNFRFSHKTFANFYIIDFINTTLLSSDEIDYAIAVKTIPIIFEIISKKEHSLMRNFLNDVVASRKHFTILEKPEFHEIFCEKLKPEINNDLIPNFIYLAEENCFETLHFILKLLSREEDFIEKMWLSRSKKGHNFITKMVKNKVDIEHIKQVLQLMKKNVSEEMQKTYFAHTTFNQNSVLSLSIKNGDTFFNFVWELIVGKFSGQTQDIINILEKNNYFVVRTAASEGSLHMVSTILDFFKNNKLSKTRMEHDLFFLKTKDELVASTEKTSQTGLTRKQNLSNMYNLLHCAAAQNKKAVIEYIFEKIPENNRKLELEKKNKLNQTAYDLAIVVNKNAESKLYLKTLMDQYKIRIKELDSARFEFSSHYTEILQYIEQSFTNENTEKTQQKSVSARYFLKLCDEDKETISKFLNEFSTPLQKKNLISLLKIPDINNDGNLPLHVVCKTKSLSTLKNIFYLLDLLEEYFEKNELSDLLKLKNNFGYTALNLSIFYQDDSFVNTFFKFHKKFFISNSYDFENSLLQELKRVPKMMDSKFALKKTQIIKNAQMLTDLSKKSFSKEGLVELNKIIRKSIYLA